MRAIRRVANGIALLVTGGLGVTFILGGAGVLSFGSISPYFDRSPGTVFLILLGAVMLLIAAQFLVVAADERVQSTAFARQAEGGRVALTAHAIRELVSGILRDELGLERFHVRLSHRGEGVSITVRVTLSPSQRVTSVSERIQSVLARQIPDRTGVSVSDVSILVRSIRSQGTTRKAREEIIHAPDSER